ncbi:MAG: Lacal_2735 family protein [Bacteroidota bacterium]
MFNLFKKKSKLEVLQQKYEKLMQEAHKLSTSNRAASDEKHAEAQKVLEQIEAERAAAK